MAEVTSKALNLTFGLANGKEMSMNINAPKTDLTGSEISAAMDQIIAANALGEESLVASKTGAKYVIKEEEAISLN